MKYAIALIILSIGHSFAQIIPANRLAPWVPGVNVGVPGGIDQYRPGGANARTNLIDITLPPYNADKTGVTDVRAKLVQAISDVPTNGVIYFPAGTYRLNSGTITGHKDNYTIRGAGMNSTTLMYYGNTLSALEVGGNFDYEWNSPSGTQGALGAALKGASTIPMADTSQMTVGQMAQITLANQPANAAVPIIHISFPNGRDRKQMVMITGKTASNITVSPALAFDLPAANSPRIAIGSFVVENVGVEDLTINGANSASPHALVMITQGLGCWLYNVKSVNTTNYNIQCNDSVRCEIRRSWGAARSSEGTNGAALLTSAASSCLFEDNIFGQQLPSLEANSSTTGCVFAYNYWYESSVFGSSGGSIDTNHAPHNSYNLYEGNIAPNVQADGYHGSCSDDTVYRNWLHGVAHGTPKTSPGGPVNEADYIKGLTVNLNRFTRNYSVVGNLLGTTTGVSFPYPGPGDPGAPGAVRWWGMPNGGNQNWTGEASPINGDWWIDFGTTVDPNGWQERDLDVEATLILKGNYNTVTASIPGNESLGGQTLSNSLFRSSKPSYFGNLVWPPFNPLSPGNLEYTTANHSRIPAGYRYINGVDPPGVGGPDTVPPALISKVINATGTQIALGFDETVSIGLGGSAGWTLNMTGGAVTVTGSPTVSGSTITWNLSRTIAAGQTGTISYVQPGNGVEDTAGNDLASLSNSAVTNTASGDTAAPTPNPSTFGIAPTALTSSTITMTATTSTDAGSPPVQYFFNEVSGNAGGSDSGWQSSPTFLDAGLAAGTQYRYRVQTRDSAVPPNVTTFSSEVSATTKSVAGAHPAMPFNVARANIVTP